ncbi:MAG: hypothetical protein IT181_13225 [Acidobacteria bacterium]|nr:hypothetical protein [Acidobacteriota bacterium]
MDWGTVLQGVGGALEGGFEGYSWAKELQQKDRQIDQREEIVRLQDETRRMLETLKENGRNTRAADTNQTRMDIAGMTAETAANAESGRNTRFEKGITAKGLWQEMQDRTRRRGQDLTDENADQRDATTRRGQDMSSATARRGQDIGAGTARMRDETTRRGQDLGAENVDQRDETTRRGQDLATDRARIRAGSSLGALPEAGADSQEMRDAAVAAANASNAGVSEVPNMPPRPAGNMPTPAAPVPPPAAGGAPAPVTAAGLRTAIDAVKNAKTPQEKQRALAALARLRAQVKR